MSAPLFWRVHIGREYFDFAERGRARWFARMQRAAGLDARIVPHQ